MREKNQNLYEGMYIFLATLSEDARKKAIERITSGIEAQGGQVHKIHDRGRQRLAYSIKGKKEGHYYLLYFSLPGESVKRLWKEYHLNEDLLRFMTMQADEVKEKIAFKSLEIQGAMHGA